MELMNNYIFLLNNNNKTMTYNEIKIIDIIKNIKSLISDTYDKLNNRNIYKDNLISPSDFFTNDSILSMKI